MYPDPGGQGEPGTEVSSVLGSLRSGDGTAGAGACPAVRAASRKHDAHHRRPGTQTAILRRARAGRLAALEVLGWTAPKIRDPAAADRWTWLIIAAYAQMRLAFCCQRL